MLAILCALALGPARAWADPPVASLALDPARTVISFSVWTTTHTVHGTFHLKRGLVQVDSTRGEARGEIVVDAASGQSGNGLRDDRMDSAVLQTDRYKEIRFAVERIHLDNRSATDFQIKVDGAMTLCGTAHPMTVVMKGHINGGALDGETRFAVPYVKWGLEDPSVLFLKVAPEVDIDIRAVGRLTWLSGFTASGQAPAQTAGK